MGRDIKRQRPSDSSFNPGDILKLKELKLDIKNFFLLPEKLILYIMSMTYNIILFETLFKNRILFQKIAYP